MKPLPAELEAKIDEVKSWLPSGGINEIASKTGVDQTNVSKMFNKKMSISDKVLKEGIKIMNERKAFLEIQERPTQMKVA